MYVNLNNIQSTLATTSNALTKPTTLTTETDAKEITATIADTVSISSSALELYTSSLNSSDEENKSQKKADLHDEVSLSII